MPLPNTVVGSHCTWQLRLNTVPARIPGEIQYCFSLDTCSDLMNSILGVEARVESSQDKCGNMLDIVRSPAQMARKIC